jgi:hypothetical protein
MSSKKVLRDVLIVDGVCRECRPEALCGFHAPPTGWHHATMMCAVCVREWVAVYPDDAPSLECPGCGYLNQLPQ